MSAVPVEVTHLTRTFRKTSAVEDLSFEVRPGRVTGLLGRNGAGKTTTLRMILGLSTPTRGEARIFGYEYQKVPGAAHRVGVSMGDIGATPGASVVSDLRACAAALGLPLRRCEEVLDFVGLEARSKKVKSLSTGMRQRHGLAVALLAAPELLILDEPASGLDPDGIRWLRDTLRSLAAEGRTVLLSSHHLAEVEQTVDDVVVLQKTLRFAGTLDELTTSRTRPLEERFFELVGAPQTGAKNATEETPPKRDRSRVRRSR